MCVGVGMGVGVCVCVCVGVGVCAWVRAKKKRRLLEPRQVRERGLDYLNDTFPALLASPAWAKVAMST